MAFDAKDKSVKELFSDNIFSIPINQREYVWEEKQWNDLINDILFANDNNQNHFIGSVVLEDNSKKDGIGYFTIIDGISKKDKHKKELEAALQILQPLNNSKKIEDLFLEFEDSKTKESIFAHMVDKLESDFQIKYYEEKGFCDWTTPRQGLIEKIRQERVAQGWKTLSKAWIEFDKEHCNYDELFKKIADYIADNIVFKV